MESYNKFSKIASIVLAIAVGLYLWIPSCNENSSDSDSKSPSQLHYSWNNKFGDRVVVDLKPDGSGTIKLVDPKTSEEYGYGYSNSFSPSNPSFASIYALWVANVCDTVLER